MPSQPDLSSLASLSREERAEKRLQLREDAATRLALQRALAESQRLPGVRSLARGARPPRCWNCRGGHTCLPLPAGGPLERAAGELGCALFCSPRASDKEVQLLRNVVRYHFRDWTKSQARGLPAPEPITGASGVSVVPQGAQAVPPGGALQRFDPL
uniref:Uncharacterized protein n=1 Tax=Pyricularia oryzae (strain P131) TaxID=1143193 RepID=L7JPB8_PYRO1